MKIFNLISDLGSLETLNFYPKIAIGMLFSFNPSHSPLIMLKQSMIFQYVLLFRITNLIIVKKEHFYEI